MGMGAPAIIPGCIIIPIGGPIPGIGIGPSPGGAAPNCATGIELKGIGIPGIVGGIAPIGGIGYPCIMTGG